MSGDPIDTTPLPSDDEDTLWRKLHTFCAARLGVTSILYGFTHSRHLKVRVGTSRSLMVRHSHPADYVDRFEGHSFLENDLCTLTLLEDRQVFLWNQASSFPDATPEQLLQARIDHECGMDAGVSLGFSFGGGHGISGFGLCARWMDPAEFERRWTEEEPEVTAWIGRVEPLLRARMVASRLKLSPRQREALALSVGGLIAKEIAGQLGIQEKTVYNYLEAARKALDSATSMEAVAKALVYGLI